MTNGPTLKITTNARDGASKMRCEPNSNANLNLNRSLYQSIVIIYRLNIRNETNGAKNTTQFPLTYENKSNMN